MLRTINNTSNNNSDNRNEEEKWSENIPPTVSHYID
jgi:hypothetical protein